MLWEENVLGQGRRRAPCDEGQLARSKKRPFQLLLKAPEAAPTRP